MGKHVETSGNDEGSRDLDVVQRWFQAVITCPEGVLNGVESVEAQELVKLQRDELEQLVRRSKNLSAEERIGIYANAYYARLLECLRESFPVLRVALGDDVFDGFAFDYLRLHPSQSYTLGRLGVGFGQFLDSTRPDRPTDGSDPPVGWPDFLIDLARLEWEIEQVFDGPGVEGKPLLSLSHIRAIDPETWGQARLVVPACLRLLAFRFPVNDYYTQARRSTATGEPPEMPEPQEQYLALTRRDFIVRRHILTKPQYDLLLGIVEGETIEQSIARAAAACDAPDDQLSHLIEGWFRDGAEAGFFETVAL